MFEDFARDDKVVPAEVSFGHVGDIERRLSMKPGVYIREFRSERGRVGGRVGEA